MSPLLKIVGAETGAPVTPEQVLAAAEQKREREARLRDTLVRLGRLNDEAVARIASLQRELGAPFAKAASKLGLLTREADGTLWRRPTTGSAEAVRLSVLAQATIQTIERYYLAIALLLRAGRASLTPEALEQRCVAMAQRMSMLYGLAAPEFFDRAMFRDFIDLLRQRGVVRQGGDGRLDYDDALLAVAQDARIVLSEQIRNSILQVTHS